MNIFVTFQKMHGNIVKNAIDHINNKFKTHYKHGRYAEWREGKRLPDRFILEYIISEVVNNEINNSSLINGKEKSKIIINLKLPEQKTT